MTVHRLGCAKDVIFTGARIQRLTSSNIPESTVDSMALCQTGSVTDFSRSSILDEAINEHEANLAFQAQLERFNRAADTCGRAMDGDLGSIEWPMREIGG